MRRSGLWLLCFVCLLLPACAGDPPRAPVEQRRGIEKTDRSAEKHLVVRGDTLHAIAWRYGMDYRALAGINNISPPYTIYPGQVLSLRAGSAPPAPQVKKPVTAPRAVTKSSPPRVIKSSNGKAGSAVDTWSWPTRGQVVRRFSGTVHKGIDIDGEAGDRVNATAAGRVVYAGSGIVGYGRLVIVKHNEDYLSAYGHNQRLLVGEGETVAAGQQIAEKGSSGTNTVKLHFEIRRQGTPVDPLKLLPTGR
jgi:lipoprotein NlpD